MKKSNETKNMELENVAGGSLQDYVGLHCKNCSCDFKLSDAKQKMAGSGCNKKTVFLCPNCGKWINGDGTLCSD